MRSDLGTIMPILELPLPLSMRAGRGRVYRSLRYKAWLVEAIRPPSFRARGSLNCT